MRKPTLDSMTIEVLRGLDAANSTVLTTEERVRAEAVYARIVTSPEGPPSVRPHRMRLGRRVWLPVGLVGAAGVAVPAFLLGGSSAFASWTAIPEPLSGVAATEAANTCVEALEAPDLNEQVVVGERRGEWTYVLLAGPRSELVCLMPEGLVGKEDAASHEAEGFMGSAGDPGKVPSPAPHRIVEGQSAAGSVPTGGLWDFRDDEEWVTWVQGYVGSDVTGVTVHTPTEGDVEASVVKGRFAAWWPSPVPSSENPDVTGAWTYTVTLADGNTHGQ